MRYFKQESFTEEGPPLNLLRLESRSAAGESWDPMSRSWRLNPSLAVTMELDGGWPEVAEDDVPAVIDAVNSYWDHREAEGPDPQ